MSAFLFSFEIQHPARAAADKAADNMGQVGDIVLHRNTLPDLLTQINHRHQNKGQRDLPFFYLGKSGLNFRRCLFNLLEGQFRVR